MGRLLRDAKRDEVAVFYVDNHLRPYTPSAFDRTLEVDGIEIGLHESSERNLGGGRGRVRRIALRMENGSQVNLVACSRESAERLVGVMIGDDEQRRGRWVQENAFKHGAQRWGVNHLDGRRVTSYDPSTIVPNPARCRLDRAVRLEYVREGLILRELEQLAEGPRRDRLRQDLVRSREEQRTLLALRPSTPKKAPLKRTVLPVT